MATTAEHVHVEEGVAVGLGACELQRETAVGSDLVGNQGGAEAVAAPLHHFVVAGETGELAGLQDPAGSVVVVGVAFLLSVLWRCASSRGIGRTSRSDLSGAAESAEMRSTTVAARATSTRCSVSMMPMPRPCIDAEDRLGVLQVGVHPGCGIDEPGAKVLAGVVGVLLLPGQQPRGGERRDDEAETDHRLAMRR